MRINNNFFLAFLLLAACTLWSSFSFSQGTWTQKASYPTTNYRLSNFAFTLNNKGYQGTGWNGVTIFNDFWEYDPVANSWTQKANFGGGPMYFGLGLAIGNKGYAGIGLDVNGNYTVGFWEYDPIANSWAQKAALPGPARARACAFAVGTKGYVATGAVSTGTSLKDIYEYDPASNSWTLKANFPPAAGRDDIDRVPFVLNNKAYLGLGGLNSVTLFNDWWEYDPASNSWTQKANFPSAKRIGASGFAICNKGYAGLGADNSTGYSDWYQYDPVANTWTAVASFPGGSRADAPTFVIANSGYVVDGYLASADLWEFQIGGALAITASATTVCNGQAVTIIASGGANYSWNTGATTSSIIVNPTTSTSYTVSDASSACGGAASIAITVGSPPAASISNNTTICTGQTTTFTASGGGNYSWSNGSTVNSISVSPTSTTTYSVVVSIGSCTDTASATATVNPSPSVSVSGNNSLCTGDVATLTASGANSYSWNTGATTTAITVSPASSTSYTVVSTNANGCSASATINVTVSPPPVASVSGTTICSGQTATLTTSGGNNYSWSNGATTSSISLILTSTSTYSVVVSTGSCSDTASANVVVNPSPNVAAFNSVTISSGQSTTLGASGGGNYSWSSGNTDASITVSPLLTTTYCVTVINSSGCSDSACVIVTVITDSLDCSFSKTGELFIPNAFSPNNDGENDRIKLLYGNYDCIKTYLFVVYDRWGEKVFESQNPKDEWNGSYNGRVENNAVFVWYMKAELLNGDKIVKKGNISLAR